MSPEKIVGLEDKACLSFLKWPPSHITITISTSHDIHPFRTGAKACTTCKNNPESCFSMTMDLWLDHCLQGGDSALDWWIVFLLVGWLRLRKKIRFLAGQELPIL